MRLACVYIPKNSLPYVFGENHSRQILNLGGKHSYSFTYSKKIKLIEVRRSYNKNFINDFWGEDISLISAIIGKNGAGKTSLLRAINEGDGLSVGTLMLFESLENDDVFLINNTEEKFTSDSFKWQILQKKEVKQLYYSPVLDQDLKDTYSPITLVSYLQSSIEEFHFDSILRNILLFREPFIESILSEYPDFPYYDKYIVSIYPLRRDHFIDTYISTNLGNPMRSDVLRNYIQGDILQIEGKKDNETYSKEELKSFLNGYLSIINSESFTSSFLRLWDQEEYKFINDQNFVNVSDDFFKSFEVTILSYLLLGAVFPQTGLGKNVDFDFEEVLDEKQFNKKLNLLLRFYIQSESELMYDRLSRKIGFNFIDNTENIFDEIKKDKFSRIGGVDYSKTKERIIRHIIIFKGVREFYDFLQRSVKEEKIILENGMLFFDIKASNVIDLYKEFIDKYYELLKLFKHIPVKPQIFKFDPNKKLSTGEKSLINLFASLNHYLSFNRNVNDGETKSFLLLLDEAELGYHPVWKKKFIKALVHTLPQIFVKTNYNNSNNKLKAKQENSQPKIQIILSTHDPLTLSDLPQSNIIYMDKTKSVSSLVQKDEQNRKNSFGANITDLLADSFFIEDGLIGEFALTKINETIAWLNKKDDKENAEHHRKLIQIIDEPVIRRKLSELFALKMDDEFSVELLRHDIENLIKRFKEQTGEDYDLS